MPGRVLVFVRAESLGPPLVPGLAVGTAGENAAGKSLASPLLVSLPGWSLALAASTSWLFHATREWS